MRVYVLSDCYPIFRSIVIDCMHAHVHTFCMAPARATREPANTQWSQFPGLCSVFTRDYPELDDRVIKSAALDMMCMRIYAQAGFGLWTDLARLQGTAAYLDPGLDFDASQGPAAAVDTTVRATELAAICEEIAAYFKDKYLPFLAAEHEKVKRLVAQLVEEAAQSADPDRGAGAEGSDHEFSEVELDARVTLRAFLASLMSLADSEPKDANQQLSRVMFLPGMRTTAVVVQDVEDMIGTAAAATAGWSTVSVQASFKSVFGEHCPNRSMGAWFWNKETTTSKTLAQLRSPVSRSFKELCRLRKAMVFENEWLDPAHKEFFSTAASSWVMEDMTA